MGNRKTKPYISGQNSLILFFISLIFCSCSVAEGFSKENPFAVTEQITFVLPDWEELGPDYPSLSVWQVSFYYCKDNSPVLSEFQVPAAEKLLVFDLPKNKPAFILATPVTFNSEKTYETLFFYPAGAVYPYFCETDSKKIIISFENGFVTRIMENILLSALNSGTSGKDCIDFISRFNWKRFSSVLEEKAANSALFNPWALNTKKISEALMGGKFTSTILNLKEPFLYEDYSYSAALSPYIPLNKILPETQLPLWHAKDNAYIDVFLISPDTMFLFYENSYGEINTGTKKLSKTTVFIPKKYEETVYAKN